MLSIPSFTQHLSTLKQGNPMLSIFKQAITAFDNGYQVFVNNCEMYAYNEVNKTISTTYSIIPADKLDSITVVE